MADSFLLVTVKPWNIPRSRPHGRLVQNKFLCLQVLQALSLSCWSWNTFELYKSPWIHFFFLVMMLYWIFALMNDESSFNNIIWKKISSCDNWWNKNAVGVVVTVLDAADVKIKEQSFTLWDRLWSCKLTSWPISGHMRICKIKTFWDCSCIECGCRVYTPLMFNDISSWQLSAEDHYVYTFMSCGHSLQHGVLIIVCKSQAENYKHQPF